MRVLLSGYYGFANVGDEAVLQSIIKGLKNSSPNVDITVLASSPEITEEVTQVKSVNRNSFFKIIFELIKCNVFVSGGGTLLQDTTSTKSFLYYIGLIYLAKLFFKKVIIFAQGFGPLEIRVNRFLARFILNRVNLITLRDNDSYFELQKLGVRRPPIYVTADPSFILNIPPKKLGLKTLSLEAIRTDKPLIGLAIRTISEENEELLHNALAKAIDWADKTYNLSPVFVLFQCPEDMEESSKVINSMLAKSNIVYKICQPDEMISIISNLDLLIGMRLHSLIFAAMCEVPMLGISYDPKVESFMKEIEQPYLNIDSAVDFKRIRDPLAWIIENKDKIKKSLKAKRKEFIKHAKTNFDLFYGFLPPQGEELAEQVENS